MYTLKQRKRPLLYELINLWFFLLTKHSFVLYPPIVVAPEVVSKTKRIKTTQVHEHGYNNNSPPQLFLCLIGIFITRILNGVHSLTSHRGLSDREVLSAIARLTIAETVASKVLAVNTTVHTIDVAIAVHGTVTSLLVAIAGRVEVVVRTSVLRTKVGDRVSLALDLGRRRNVGALLGRANGEDRALPLVTLAGKLLVLGGLGADATREVDVGEDAVLLGHGNVGLLVGSDFLSLLLLLGELLLSGVVVAVVDVRSVLRVVLGLSRSTVGLLLHLVEDLVKLVALILDSLLNSLLQRGSDDLEHDGLQHREEQLVVGLLDLDLDLRKVNVNLLDLEVVLAILLVGGGDLHLKGKAIAGEDNVNNTLIGDGGESLLAVDVVAHVTEIHLDASNLDLHGLMVLVGNLLATPAEVVLAGNLQDIGSEVVTLEDKVLDDSIELRVGVLNSGNGDVGNVLQGSRDNDIPQVLEQMGLEDRLAVLVVTKVLEQLCQRLSKGVVLRILVELVGEELDLVNNTVGVAAVLVAEEVSTLIVELIPLTGGLVLQNVALLKEASADVRVHRLEPILELAVVISVLVDLADSLPKILGGGTVGESLNDSAEVALSGTETTTGVLSSVGRSLANGATVAAVSLSQTEESLDGLGVVLVLLALKNHLLEAPDSLVLALLRHLLVEVVVGLAAVLLVALEDVLLGLRVDLVVELLLGSLLGGTLASLGVGLASGVASGISRCARGGRNVARLGASGDLRVVHALLVGLEVTLLIALNGLLLSRSSRVDTSGSDVLGILLRVATVNALGLLLEVLLGEIRGLMPDIVLSRLVQLLELLLRGTNTGSSVGSGITSHVAEENSGIGEKLSELTVGDEKLTKSPQTLKGLVTVLLGNILADRSVGCVDVLGVELSSLVDEVLDQVALVLGKE